MCTPISFATGAGCERGCGTFENRNDHRSIGLVTLRDDIFPAGPPRDENVVRTEWVGTWESQLLGIGRLTAFLTDRLLWESFAVDDMALYVIFLQRHRVDVSLKLILERGGVTIKPTHNLQSLLDACKDALLNLGMAAEWQQFGGAQQEYVELVDGIDPGAATFRYPVDRNEQPWARDDFVDLAAFEKAGVAFQGSVLDLLEDLARLEPLPVQASDAKDAAQELRDLQEACRHMTSVTEHLLTELGGQGRAMAARAILSAQAKTAIAGYEAVVENTRELTLRADRMLARIEAAFHLQPPPEQPDAPLPYMPKMTIALDHSLLAAQVEATIKATATVVVDVVRPLVTAVNAVEARSASWSTPYAQQLHAEVARLQSRLSRLSLNSTA